MTSRSFAMPGPRDHDLRSLVLPFTKQVAAATMDLAVRRCAVEGQIIAAYLHFPPGANALVEVRILLASRRGEVQVVPTPSETFIALDSVTFPAENLFVPVEVGDDIRVEWWNFDGANPHRVPVEVILARQEARPSRSAA